jgi:hypothetical protein
LIDNANIDIHWFAPCIESLRRSILRLESKIYLGVDFELLNRVLCPPDGMADLFAKIGVLKAAMPYRGASNSVMGNQIPSAAGRCKFFEALTCGVLVSPQVCRRPDARRDLALTQSGAENETRQRITQSLRAILSLTFLRKLWIDKSVDEIRLCYIVTNNQSNPTSFRSFLGGTIWYWP